MLGRVAADLRGLLLLDCGLQNGHARQLSESCALQRGSVARSHRGGGTQGKACQCSSGSHCGICGIGSAKLDGKLRKDGGASQRRGELSPDFLRHIDASYLSGKHVIINKPGQSPHHSRMINAPQLALTNECSRHFTIQSHGWGRFIYHVSARLRMR